MSEWISVKDRLPPQDGTPFIGYDPSKEEEDRIYVLVFIKAKRYPPGEFEKFYYEDHYLEASGENYFTWNPSHWMPVPEPPNVSVNEKLPLSQFEFRSDADADADSWVIRITKDGITFNHEKWPNSSPSDFAQAFCDILEKNYDVTFIKRVKRGKHN